MGAIDSQITSLTIVYSTVYSDPDQRKYQSSASLAFVLGIHRWPVNSTRKWPVTWKMFPFDDVIILNRSNTESEIHHRCACGCPSTCWPSAHTLIISLYTFSSEVTLTICFKNSRRGLVSCRDIYKFHVSLREHRWLMICKYTIVYWDEFSELHPGPLFTKR